MLLLTMFSIIAPQTPRLCSSLINERATKNAVALALFRRHWNIAVFLRFNPLLLSVKFLSVGECGVIEQNSFMYAENIAE